ncbi:MAG: MCE family protein [Actinomycetota bacterium]|nr:MCE family protein [Actinomycetota bacterium]
MAMPEKLKVKINLIVFLVGAFVLLYAMATQVLSILEPTYSVNAIFPDAGGVFTDQEVTYRGLTVGQVGKMEVVEEGVKLELKIFEKYKIPKENVEARVMFKSAVGEQFVDVLPGSDDPPYLQDGDEISIERTSIPVSTQALLTTTQSVLEGVPPEALHGAVDSLAEGLAGQGSDIALLLESLADLSETFADAAPEVEGILRNGTTVGDAFLRSRDDFADGIRDLITVADILADNRPNLERLMTGANLLSDELVALIRENRGTLNQIIKDLADINDFQADAKKDINQLFNKLPYALQNVVKAFESKTGLVRFGLVQDSNNHGCDYSAVNRRPPQDRSPRLPPKHAVCKSALKSGGGDEAGADDTSGDSPEADVPESDSSELGQLLLPDLSDDAGRLPARMRDWGWAFFYLNSLQ